MAVNAQNFLADIQKTAALKNTAQSKAKRVIVPDLSIFGIPNAKTNSTVQARKAPMTGANATAKPDKATSTCEPQSSFLPRQEAAPGQVYPEQQQDEKVQAQQFEPQLLQKTQVLSEKDSSAAIELLMKKAMMIRQAVDSRKEITDRVGRQESEFEAVFQPEYTEKHDHNYSGSVVKTKI